MNCVSRPEYVRKEKMGIIKRFKKNYRMMKIMKRLGQPMAVEELTASLLSKKDNTTDSAKQDLLDLVLGDDELRIIMTAYGATPKDIEQLFNSLTSMGLGWAGGNYIPAAAIALNPTLDYLLRMTKGKDGTGLDNTDKTIKIACDLKNYFQQGRMGRV